MYPDRFFRAFSSVVRQMPRYNQPRRGTVRTLPNCCVVLCIVCFVSFFIFFMCKRVLYYCHRVITQLQLKNISYHIIITINTNFLITNYAPIFKLYSARPPHVMTREQIRDISNINLRLMNGFFFLVRPLSAGLALRPTFYQRCIVGRVWKGLIVDDGNYTNYRSDRNMQKIQSKLTTTSGQHLSVKQEKNTLYIYSYQIYIHTYIHTHC